MVRRAAIAFGSNLGDRTAHIERALQKVRDLPGTRCLRISSLFETEPVGGPPQGSYQNGAATLETELDAAGLLAELLRIEADCGRVRRERNGPRVIDLDLILFGTEVHRQPGLTVPHPRAHERAFVLEPLAEVAGDWEHPDFHCTVQELWDQVRIQAR